MHADKRRVRATAGRAYKPYNSYDYAGNGRYRAGAGRNADSAGAYEHLAAEEREVGNVRALKGKI